MGEPLPQRAPDDARDRRGMRIEKQQLEMSASDLAKHLACRHLTSLDLRAARGEIDRPYWHDPAIAVLQERGFRHPHVGCRFEKAVAEKRGQIAFGYDVEKDADLRLLLHQATDSGIGLRFLG